MTSIPMKRVGFVLFAVALAATVGAAEVVPEPEGYRQDDYRSPVPSSISGGRMVTTAEAERLWRSKSAVFIDMLARPEKPKNLPAGTLWRDKPRENIPGSVWLANTGYGVLSEELACRFRQGLEAATGGDRAKPLVFYCLAECWMSWNGAKRALSLGYTSVNWYPDGTDGWAEASLPLEPSLPVGDCGRP